MIIRDNQGIACELDDSFTTPPEKWEAALDRGWARMEDQLTAWRSWKFVYLDNGEIAFLRTDAKLGDETVLAYGPAECTDGTFGCAAQGRIPPTADCHCGVNSITDFADLAEVRAMADVVGPGEVEGRRQASALALVVPFGKLCRGKWYDPPSTVRSEYVIALGVILPRDVEDPGGNPVIGFGNYGQLAMDGVQMRRTGLLHELPALPLMRQTIRAGLKW